tara:strand:- start:301 stop:936 length:636 start_codon:yes stop_codon:yes gene_type:complete
MATEKLIQAPIPGQSLTDLPKNSPWEKPSELNEVSDVIRHYVDRLADDEVMDDLSVVFELGGDLKTVTETICMAGSMNGTHTVEAGMLAGPVVASFLKAAMKSYGIDTPETNVDPDEAASAREYSRVMALVDQALEQGGEDQGLNDPGQNLLREMLSTETSSEQPMEVDEPMEEAPMELDMPLEDTSQNTRGLGSRSPMVEPEIMELEGEE